MTRRWSPISAWFLVAILIALAPSSAQAQVKVRSGEHPGHSRLVFQFASMPKWELSPGDRRHLLEFDPAPTAYSLDEVFRFIPRTRLSDVSADPGGNGIVLELNCDCRIEIYETRARALVVDVHDPDGRPRNPTEWAFEGSIESMSPRFVMAHTPDAVPDAPAASERPDPSPFPTPLAQAPLFPFPTLPRNDAMVQPGLTRALAEELARAASQGLVTAESDIQMTVSDQESPEASGDEDGLLSEGGSDAGIDELVRLRTGLDRAFATEESPLPGLSPIASCPKSGDYDLINWGEPEAVHRQIADLRQKLLGEFDTVDTGTALNLARLQIYLTLDVETVNFLDRFLPDHPQNDALSALALLVGQGVHDPGVARLGECGGALPLLAFLSTPLDEIRAPFRKDAILLYFSDFPTHLRRHLAEPLAERFAAVGDSDSVRIILGSVGRVSPDNDPNLVMATAKGSATGAIPRETGAALEDLATSLRLEASEALLINIHDRLAREERIPQDLIDMAEILSFEQTGSTEGQRLKAAQIAALFENGSFLKGFVELKKAEPSGRLSPSQAADAWRSGFLKSLKSAGDATFARLLFEPEFAPGLEWVGADGRKSIAERLLSLGFPSRAEDVLAIQGADTDEYLAARLAKANQDLERAVALAMPIDDPEAQVFLAETLATAGRHAEAHEIFSLLLDQDRQNQEAWRAGQWDLVAEGDDTTKSSAARAMVSLDRGVNSVPVETAAPTLSASANLLDESVSLRATIDALLSDLQNVTD